MKYTLPSLPYDYKALEPHIDEQTMIIHHDKHHQAYTDKLNTVLEKYPDIADRPLEELLRDIETLEMEAADKKMLRNNGGGYLNHNLFWEVMGPEKEVDEELVNQIKTTFGSMDEFKKIFSENAANQFGSGWSWLVRDSAGNLKAYATPNQDSPYMNGDTPVFGLDVWEHAYYLKYQNKRPDYIQAWWNTLKLIP
jgi:Fe-Mn family superoxide dismutase